MHKLLQWCPVTIWKIEGLPGSEKNRHSEMMKCWKITGAQIPNLGFLRKTREKKKTRKNGQKK